MNALHFDRVYPQRARKQFTQMAEEMKREVDSTQEPKLRALLQTSAEMLNGIAKTFSDYEIRTMRKD